MESKASWFKEIEFEIEREVWSRYELSDNAELRSRIIVVKILQGINEKDPTKTDYTGDVTNINTIVPLEAFNLKGPPSKQAYSQSDILNARSVEVDYKTIIEDWNVYRLADGSKLRTKLVVASVKRLLDMYDAHGIPIYNINSSHVINFDQSKRKDFTKE